MPSLARLRIAQMTALSQIGRRTEALGVYDDLRRGLSREFGLTPSEALSGFYQELLRDGDARPLPSRRPLHRLAGRSMLPREVPAFTGSQHITQKLAGALAGGEQLAVLSGPVGAGKTGLAVHAAHCLRDEFPDGCYFARLRAHDGSVRSVRQVLTQVCSTMVPARAATGPDDLLVSWQHWLSTHRALVVLERRPLGRGCRFPRPGDR